jgi:ER membrane protein complex subunit 1
VLKSDKFPMYDPVIPQLNTKFVTYDLQLVGLERIQTFSSRLESTTQVFAYGHDLFLARVKPDGSFDLLDEEFNYFMLFGCIVLILFGNLYMSRMVKKEQTRTQFLTL